MDISIQKATKKDYQVIQQIEDNSFGVHIAFEEAQLIIEKDYGEVFIAYELEKPVGYQVVLFKEYDAETEAYLQPIIRRRKAQKEKVMHDDVNFDENRYVYFHLLGVINEYQGKGIASLIKRHAKEIVLRRFPRKSVKICIRINNLPSIRVNMKTLGVYLESIKPNNWNILGSVETNFNAIGKKGNRPILEVSDITKYEIYSRGNSTPIENTFLLPVSYGEENALLNGVLKEQLESIFRNGYIINGLLREGEKSFFHCEKK